MGLLDDAIREHLELKRRHGADAGEIARLEQEALGPARRTATEDLLPAPEATAPPASPAEPAVGEARAPVVEDDFVFEGHDEFDEGEPPVAEAALEQPETDVLPASRAAPEPPATPEPPADEPQATVEFEPGSEEDWADDWDSPERSGTPAPDPEPQAAEPGPEPSDDVLEETPDFLQETPEHDRLWFEQKPPRDFEF